MAAANMAYWQESLVFIVVLAVFQAAYVRIFHIFQAYVHPVKMWTRKRLQHGEIMLGKPYTSLFTEVKP